jgi:hypothetical protein
LRRSPIWQREGVYYYTADDGRRISLRTKDRAEALRRHRQALEPPPDPPAPAAAAPPRATAPPPRAARAGGGGPPPPPNGADPLLEVGAGSSSSDSGAPGGGGDEGGGMPLSEEEVNVAAREMAKTLVDLVAGINGRIALARTGRLGFVKRETYERTITAWLPITRRWALAWELGPWTAEHGTVAVDGAPAGPPGVPVHESARAQ